VQILRLAQFANTVVRLLSSSTFPSVVYWMGGVFSLPDAACRAATRSGLRDTASTVWRKHGAPLSGGLGPEGSSISWRQW